MTNLIKSSLFVIVLGTGLILSGCAGTPDINPAVKKAQEDYRQIENDSLVINNASAALKKAEQAVNDAENAVNNGENQTVVQQQAFLAQQRVKIAKKTAALLAARDEVRRTEAERRKLLAQVRKVEVQIAERGAREAEEEQLKMMQAREEIGELANQLSKFEVQQTDRGLIIRLDIKFDTETAYLKSSAEPQINELADLLDEYPNRNVLIEGHTDNTGESGYNQTLSQKRADAVRSALMSRGIDGKRIGAIGLGEQYPRSSNSTEMGRQQNRRVDIIISNNSGEIPERG